MAYSETRIVIGGLAHVPVLIFIANFIKGKFGIKTEETKDTVVKEEPVKIRDLNPRPLPYQGSALPLSYKGNFKVGRVGFEPT